MAVTAAVSFFSNSEKTLIIMNVPKEIIRISQIIAQIVEEATFGFYDSGADREGISQEEYVENYVENVMLNWNTPLGEAESKFMIQYEEDYDCEAYDIPL